MMIEIGRLQAAHLDVEIAQAGGDARQFAVALKRFGRHIDRDGQGLGETLESAVVAAGFGQFVEPALGILDLRARRKIHRRVEGDIDHVLADPDQVAAQRQFVDRASIILGIDDGGRFGGEAGEVLADRHAADVGFGRHEGLQRDRGGDLAHPDQAAGGLEDGLVDRLEEVLRLQKIRHPIERVIVDQDRAQHALLGLDIVRCAPIGRSSRVGSELENVRIKWSHGSGLVLWILSDAGRDKAPLPRAAKAASALCPIHTMSVGESRARPHSRLTDLPTVSVASMETRKISARAEPYSPRGHTHPREGERPEPYARRQSNQDEIDQRDQGRADAGGDQGIVGADVARGSNDGRCVFSAISVIYDKAGGSFVKQITSGGFSLRHGRQERVGDFRVGKGAADTGLGKDRRWVRKASAMASSDRGNLGGRETLGDRETAERLWLSMLVDAMEEISRPDIARCPAIRRCWSRYGPSWRVRHQPPCTHLVSACETRSRNPTVSFADPFARPIRRRFAAAAVLPRSIPRSLASSCAM